MPYADREKKLAHMREWRKKKIGQGYGKWLYARRKLRFEDAERFREALERIIEIAEHGRMTDKARLGEIIGLAQRKLKESREAEEALGEFQEPT